MIALDIVLVALLVTGVVGGITAISANRAQTKALRSASAPDRRLSTAIRLIDRMISGHNAGMAMLPKDMLDEAQQLVDQYYQR